MARADRTAPEPLPPNVTRHRRARSTARRLRPNRRGLDRLRPNPRARRLRPARTSPGLDVSARRPAPAAQGASACGRRAVVAVRRGRGRDRGACRERLGRRCRGRDAGGDEERRPPRRRASSQPVAHEAEGERRPGAPPRPREVAERPDRDAAEAGLGQRGAEGGRVVARPDERVRVGGVRLDDLLEAPAGRVGNGEIGGHERMPAVDGRDDQRSARSQPRGEVREGSQRRDKVLDGERAERQVERPGSEGITVAAQVDRRELVEVGRRRRRRRVEVDPDEAADAGAEPRQRRGPTAARVEHGERATATSRRAAIARDGLLDRLGAPRDRLGALRVRQGALEHPAQRRPDARTGAPPREDGLPRGHQPAATTAGAASACSSSQRSASMAARQPSPAAVTAWRYRWSCTSPAMKTPSISERVSSITRR